MSELEELKSEKLSAILADWKEVAVSHDGIEPGAGIETMLATAVKHGNRSFWLIGILGNIASILPVEIQEGLAESLLIAEKESDDSVEQFTQAIRAAILEAVNR